MLSIEEVKYLRYSFDVPRWSKKQRARALRILGDEVRYTKAKIRTEPTPGYYAYERERLRELKSEIRYVQARTFYPPPGPVPNSMGAKDASFGWLPDSRASWLLNDPYFYADPDKLAAQVLRRPRARYPGRAYGLATQIHARMTSGTRLLRVSYLTPDTGYRETPLRVALMLDDPALRRTALEVAGYLRDFDAELRVSLGEWSDFSKKRLDLGRSAYLNNEGLRFKDRGGRGG